MCYKFAKYLILEETCSQCIRFYSLSRNVHNSQNFLCTMSVCLRHFLYFYIFYITSTINIISSHPSNSSLPNIRIICKVLTENLILYFHIWMSRRKRISYSFYQENFYLLELTLSIFCSPDGGIFLHLRLTATQEVSSRPTAIKQQLVK